MWETMFSKLRSTCASSCLFMGASKSRLSFFNNLRQGPSSDRPSGVRWTRTARPSVPSLRRSIKRARSIRFSMPVIVEGESCTRWARSLMMMSS